MLYTVLMTLSTALEFSTAASPDARATAEPMEKNHSQPLNLKCRIVRPAGQKNPGRELELTRIYKF